MIAAKSVSDWPIAGRMSGFVRHLRLNGFPLGPVDTGNALRLIADAETFNATYARLGLKTALCGQRDEWEQFDALFEAYWHGWGKTKSHPPQMSGKPADGATHTGLWEEHLASGKKPKDAVAEHAEMPPGEGSEEASRAIASGRLIATPRDTLRKTDLRRIVNPDEVAEAEAIALRLARAIRFNLARRYQANWHGDKLDLRRTIRRSLSRGGEPIDLSRRRRIVRPVRIVVLLDVSGSMKEYSRYYLQFVRGLVGQWVEAEAFLFHTRLIKVSDAMRERDPMRALMRLSLITEGFGGGTKIGESLRVFNDRHAATVLNSRSVAIIMSDGYDTGAPGVIRRELKRLRKKTRRIIWLNPLLGWKTYEPVARAMVEAMPHIDCFARATTLEDLARLEPQLARL